MKIAIFGSWKESKIKNWNLRGSKEEFENACIKLGMKIAQYRHSIVVGSQSPNTADLHVVKGVIEEVKDKSLNNPLIIVLSPKYEPSPFEDLARKFPHIFAFYSATQPFWEAAHLIAVKEADAIIVIGGVRSSYSAGLASMISDKRLVPIGSFGGAGEKLLSILENMPDIENKDNFTMLRGPWTDFRLQLVLKLIGIYDYPKILIIHGRSNDWIDLKDYLQNTLRLPEPVVMEQQFGEGKTLPEKFEYLASHVDAAIALATPDDIGRPAIDNNGQVISEDNGKCNPRARQNVWLEVGWVWGCLGRNRIMILCRGNIEIPSDAAGIEVYFYDKKPQEKGDQIRLFIEKLRG